MKTLLPLRPQQSQDVRRRGPYVPLCHPKLRPKQEQPAIVPKIHLSYIPPSLRRPSPWGAFLSDWLASCEEKKSSAAGSPPPSPSPLSSSCLEEDEACSSRSSSSGACSGDTVTTDFSSVSSPRKAAEYRVEHPAPQPRRSYAVRGPRPASSAMNLSPAQWAELLQLQQAAIRQKQTHPPPKLMNIHTAYFPALDAAVLQMLHPQRLQQAPPPPSHPWQHQSHTYFNPNDQRYVRGASTASSDSAHFSDARDRSHSTCDFCYQFAVHEAMGRAAHLPRLTDKGPWRGHETKEGGAIICPRLLRRVCSMCGATGQSAHVTNFCPTTNRKTSRY